MESPCLGLFILNQEWRENWGKVQGSWCTRGRPSSNSIGWKCSFTLPTWSTIVISRVFNLLEKIYLYGIIEYLIFQILNRIQERLHDGGSFAFNLLMTGTAFHLLPCKMFAKFFSFYPTGFIIIVVFYPRIYPHYYFPWFKIQPLCIRLPVAFRIIYTFV